MARKPAQTPARLALDEAALLELAGRATYVGSKEHKVRRWWGGLPGVRIDRKTGRAVGRPHKQMTTVCLLVSPLDRDQATLWIREAILSGRCRFMEGDGAFPKHVWLRVAGQAWFGYCINTASGTYKGWPLEDDDRNADFD